jgi:hypothetical protein
MAVTELRGDGLVGFKGRLSLTSVDAGWLAEHRAEISQEFRRTGRLVIPAEQIHDRCEGDNIMCTAGVTMLAQALVWSGIQDQAANLGVTSPTYLTPLWGAIGDGTAPVTVAASDTQLAAEVSRTTVGDGASVPSTSSIPAQLTWLFYFPQPASTWTLTEAGVFVNASGTTNAGTLLDHWAFSPTISVPTTDTVLLQASFSITGM